MGWRTVAGALEAGTAACAAINSVYFLDRLLFGPDRAARRVAVAVLAIVSFGTLIESLTLIAVSNGPADPALTASASWAMAGAAGLSLLIARGAVLR